MKTIIQSAKLLLLFMALGIFMAADYMPSENNRMHQKETITVNKLPVMISCFGCDRGNGMMIVHNPNDRNLAYYANPVFDIRWYTSTGKLYASNTIAAPYVCDQGFTVKVTNKKTGERGLGGIAPVACRQETPKPVIMQFKKID